MIQRFWHFASLLLAGLLIAGPLASPASAQVNLAEQRWEIGPVAQGRNYSLNMPAEPRYQRGGWSFEFPYATARNGHVHYLTTPVRGLYGAREIIVRYRIDAARGTRFIAQASPQQAPTISLYFQRAGDNWTGQGRYRFHRWYAPAGSLKPVAPGQYEMRVRLDDPRWIAVSGGVKSGDSMRAFTDALANASRVGIVFGSPGLRGHGVFATAPARFTLLDFQIR